MPDTIRRGRPKDPPAIADLDRLRAVVSLLLLGLVAASLLSIPLLESVGQSIDEKPETGQLHAAALFLLLSSALGSLLGLTMLWLLWTLFS